MPLTPADVHNVAFSKPPIGKRGYNEDEVDAFLDLVEGELARLHFEHVAERDLVHELLGGLRLGAGGGNGKRDGCEKPRREDRDPAVHDPSL